MCESYEIINATEIRDYLEKKFHLQGNKIYIKIVNTFANPTRKNLTFQGQNIIRARITKQIRVCARIIADCKVRIYLIDTHHDTDKC